MAYDPVSRKLAAAAPVASEDLLAAIARFEDLPLPELTARRDACEARFRAWAADPANAARPLTDCPDYLDRIALDTLVERRMWQE